MELFHHMMLTCVHALPDRVVEALVVAVTAPVLGPTSHPVVP